MRKKVLFYIILAIAVFVLFATGNLAWNELEIGNVCPKLVGMPACYIILACISTALLSHLQILPGKNVFYYAGAGLAGSIALAGTIGNLVGIIYCPKTSTGIPMCYLSLLFFSTLIILKFWASKTT